MNQRIIASHVSILRKWNLHSSQRIPSQYPESSLKSRCPLRISSCRSSYYSIHHCYTCLRFDARFEDANPSSLLIDSFDDVIFQLLSFRIIELLEGLVASSVALVQTAFCFVAETKYIPQSPCRTNGISYPLSFFFRNNLLIFVVLYLMSQGIGK